MMTQQPAAAPESNQNHEALQQALRQKMNELQQPGADRSSHRCPARSGQTAAGRAARRRCKVVNFGKHEPA